MLTVAVHIHSKYSYDSFSDVEAILRTARYNHIDVLAITDHDTMQGSLQAIAMAKNYGITCIPGAEDLTDCGDVIGLFLKEEIKTRNAFELIEEIKKQGGLSILPHPYYHHKRIEELATHVDCIEIFNSRCTKEENDKAQQLAVKFNKPYTAGGDAHLVSEVPNVQMQYNYDGEVSPEMFLKVTPLISSKYSRREDVYYSQMIKGIKGLSPLMVARQVYNLAKYKILK